MIYIGIDPGKGGGLAALASNGEILRVIRMPETERDVLDFLCQRWHDEDGVMRAILPARAMLEKVHAMPGQGVTSMFTFGKGYGGLRMALTAAAIPFDEVTPQAWQRAMQCRSGGDKNVTKRRAQDLFPKARPTHAIADAMLLAEYCRRCYEKP